ADYPLEVSTGGSEPMRGLTAWMLPGLSHRQTTPHLMPRRTSLFDNRVRNQNLGAGLKVLQAWLHLQPA
ncbi:MAG: hypothetical protein ACREDR_20785, partial [Blastocatellia bacterium]